MFCKISLVLFLVAANGFFVAAEFALVKLRLQELKILAREGSKTAKMVEFMMVHRDIGVSCANRKRIALIL